MPTTAGKALHRLAPQVQVHTQVTVLPTVLLLNKIHEFKFHFPANVSDICLSFSKKHMHPHLLIFGVLVNSQFLFETFAV